MVIANNIPKIKKLIISVTYVFLLMILNMAVKKTDTKKDVKYLN